MTKKHTHTFLLVMRKKSEGKKMKAVKKNTVIILLALIIAAGQMVSGVIFNPYTVCAAGLTAQTVIEGIKEEVSDFPFEDEDEIVSKRRVLGVKVKNLKCYKAYQKTTGTRDACEYILFVGRAKSSAKAKKSLAVLKKYVKAEKKNMENYLSAEGKEIFSKAKAGRMGKWFWVSVIGSSDDNKAAGKIIKGNN